MTRTRLLVVSVAVALLGGPFLAGAQDYNVTVRGFISQGYLKSSDNRFLTVATDEGSFAFTEAALNVSAEPLPRLRVAAQFLARDLGAQGNNRVVLDWGLGEYRAWDELGFRLGRIKNPLGLYNTVADVDMARPEIFQPGGVYQAERRDLQTAFDGFGVFGTFDLGGAGFLEYEGLLGTIDLEESLILARAIGETSADLVPALGAMGFSGVGYVVNERSGRAKSAYAGFLEWRPPVTGLRLRAGVQGARARLAGATTFSGFAGQVPVSLLVRSDFLVRVPHELTLSAEYSRGGLRLTFEHLSFGQYETTGSLTGLPVPVPLFDLAKAQATYGQVAYRYRDVQASSYYSVYYPDRDDKDGAGFAARGLPAFLAWTKDLAFTLRWDINRHWLIKGEIHDVNGAGNLSRSENPEPLVKDWTLFALKATVHF